MRKFDKYGFYRALEPKNSFLQTAWRIDNSMEIQESELLIDVEILNINFVSFAQILEEAKGSKERIASRIMEIVNIRGKLHNPVTGTGGMLYGKIRKIGKLYSNPQGLKVGDEVISLVSLSTTPLKIDKIIHIDIGFAQVSIVGQAIMFQSSLISKKPEDLPLRVLISAYGEAGAPTEAFRTVQPGNRVIILSAFGKMGLMCSYAVRDKLGSTGKLVGVVHRASEKEALESCGIYDEVICCDIGNTFRLYNHYLEENKIFDVVINCSAEAYTEMSTLLLVRNKGIVYFASLTSDCKIASLTAESIGKDVTIIPYRGYVEGHTTFTSNLIRKHPKLRAMIEEGHDNNVAFLDTFKSADQISIKNEIDIISNQENSNYVFKSEIMNRVLADALKVAKYDCTILICGESGTGKEIMAHFIYNNSKRNNFPFIKINCASIPEHLLESELFGYEKGAFTGADPKGKKGLWEMAQGGILFLDEIGELPITLQSKLLRVLQENEIYRVGGTKPIRTDARIIAATNKDLIAMVEKGELREDLFYRLNVFPINVPPLRDRREDIEPLIKVLIKQYSLKFNISKSIEPSAIKFLSNCDWPGNIRELQNFIQRLLINTETNIIKLEDVRRTQLINGVMRKETIIEGWENLIQGQQTLDVALEQIEADILKKYKERYKTTRKMAAALGLTQSRVSRKLCKYGIK